MSSRSQRWCPVGRVSVGVSSPCRAYRARVRRSMPRCSAACAVVRSFAAGTSRTYVRRPGHRLRSGSLVASGSRESAGSAVRFAATLDPPSRKRRRPSAGAGTPAEGLDPTWRKQVRTSGGRYRSVGRRGAVGVHAGRRGPLAGRARPGSERAVPGVRFPRHGQPVPPVAVRVVARRRGGPPPRAAPPAPEHSAVGGEPARCYWGRYCTTRPLRGCGSRALPSGNRRRYAVALSSATIPCRASTSHDTGSL
jgi:hypothetical protein